MPKFESIQDATDFINAELSRRGYVRDEKIDFESGSETHLENHKLVINVINKLLTHLDALSDTLKTTQAALHRQKQVANQPSSARSSQKVTKHVSKPAPTMTATTNSTMTTPTHPANSATKIIYKEKNTKYLEARVRKLNTQLLHLQEARLPRNEITWGTPLKLPIFTTGVSNPMPTSPSHPPLISSPSTSSPSSNPNYNLDTLSQRLQTMIAEKSDAARDLDQALALLASINKHVYMRHVLHVTLSDPKPLHHSQQQQQQQQPFSSTTSTTNPRLRELARDWEDIAAQLP